MTLFIGLQLDSGKSIFKGLGKNKTYYFFNSIISGDKENAINLPQAVNLYHENENKDFNDLEYPFKHFKKGENTLGPFFDLQGSDPPPNIVFIIVESLSSSFSGVHADEISYTPFLDSLSEHSLYFENSLATGERTFAVLPSVLGSLPHGKKGFTYERVGFPNSTSLLKWLKTNGYSSNFYYGGNAKFDYMDLYLEDQGVDNIYDGKEFRTEGLVKQKDEDPSPFGKSDRQLFKQVFENQSQYDSETPYLDIVLTLSMHYPFIIEDEQKYRSRALAIIEAAKSSKALKEKHEKYLEAFSTMVYTDNVLSDYFHQRKNKPDHHNTIYIILGDHMMSDIPHSNTLEKYRSPLLIYSPLLKRSKRIKAVNSHLDIAPSLEALLTGGLKLTKIEGRHWMGSPFDTLRSFRNNRNILFMRNKRTYEDFLNHGLYLSEGSLFEVGKRLNLSEIDSKEDLERVEKLKMAYQKLHSYTVLKDRIQRGEQGSQLHSMSPKEITISENDEYVNLSKYTIKDSLKELKLAMSLSLLEGWEYKTDENDESQPLLIVSINRNGKSKIYDRLTLNLDQEGLNSSQEIMYTVQSNSDYQILPNDEVSIYFWNKEKKKLSYQVLIQKMKINGIH